jgi:penicillin-binding protein 2
MVIANKGNYYRPHAVNTIRNKPTGLIGHAQQSKRQMTITNAVWDVVREGMYRCVNESGGTGGAARVPGVAVAGKTGTAENPHGEDHAWFVGFAPFDNPKIAVCVMVENAGFGGAIAAPMAGLCIEKYLYGSIVRYRRQPVVAQHADTTTTVNPRN